MEDTAQQEVTSLFSNAQKKILMVVVAGLFIIASILFILFSLSQKSKQSSQQAMVTPTAFPQRSLPQKAKPAPVVSFSSYTNQATVPTVPSSLNAYTLKTNFSLEEVKQFAKQFGLTAYKPTIQKEIVFYSEEKNTRGYMLFNKDTGIFSFQSWGILKPIAIGATPITTALSFLKQLSIADDTVSCAITYKRKVLPQDLTFVECHRIPERLGTILVNPVGILNLPETTSLSTLKVGYAGINSPVDKDIYQSNIGEEGKARPNDFNTITVGVFPDGRIFSVDSTMRWIKESTPITTILSPQEALDNFRQQKASFSLTIPAGAGKLNWDTVYPNNKAEAEEATITDYRLVYTEKPPTTTQTSYEPYYLIRGTARLKTGYMVRFVQTVPATVTSNVLGTQITKQLAALQFRPYYPPTNTPIPTQSPVIVTPTVSILTPTSLPITTEEAEESSRGEETTYSCSKSWEDNIPERLRFDLQIQNFGTLTVVAYRGTYHWVSARTIATEMSAIRETFFEAIKMQYEINVARWIRENRIQKNEINSVADVEKIFIIMNEERSFLTEAPLSRGNITVLGDPEQTETYYGNRKMVEIHGRVAKSIYEAFTANNLQRYADKEDIFPPLQHYMAQLFVTTEIFSNYLDGSIRNVYSSCYISGTSPALFIYTTENIQASIQPVSFISYVQPVLSKTIWNITMNNNTMYVNNVLTDYLYYEYDNSKVKFTEPQEGYVVKKEEWKKAGETIALQAGLNDKEKQALFIDIKNVLSKITTPYMKISIVNEQEITEKLPLSISPIPNSISRIHLLLSPQRGSSTPVVPVLSPLVRNGFTVVEVGVAVGK